MSETTIKIKATFRTNAASTRAMSRLNTAARRRDHDLHQALCYLDPGVLLDGEDGYDIESIARRKREVYIDVLTGLSIEAPTWIAAPLVALDAQLVSISESFDEGKRDTFIAGKKAKRVSRAQYEKWRREILGNKAKKARSSTRRPTNVRSEAAAPAQNDTPTNSLSSSAPLRHTPSIEEPRDYVTDLYFFCEELQTKRAIANLFRHRARLHRPSKADGDFDELYQKFSAKLRKLSPKLHVSIGFFSSVLFGAKYGPLVTCPQKGPATVTIVHDDEVDQKPRQLIEFVSALDDGVEAAVEAIAANPPKAVILKRSVGEKVDARHFEIDDDKSDAALLQSAVETYQWVQLGLSFGAARFSESEEHFRSLLDKVTSADPSCQLK